MLCSLGWPRLSLHNNVHPLDSRTENDSEETRGQLGWCLKGKANKQNPKNQGRQAAGLETVGEEKVKSLGPQAREPGRLVDGRLLSSWIAGVQREREYPERQPS